MDYYGTEVYKLSGTIAIKITNIGETNCSLCNSKTFLWLESTKSE